MNTYRELKPTPLLLTVLVLLYEAPMHPYQMQRLMRERDKDFVTDVKPGSIYHAVQRLDRAGLAEVVETSREGRRPERTTYRITDDGRETCEEWVRIMIGRPKTEHPPFVAGLAAMPVLQPKEAKTALTDRMLQLEREIAALEAGLRETGKMVDLPRVFVLETDYVLAVRRAEAAWVRGIIDELSSGELTWTQEELKQFGESVGRQP
jgi:DNA-binding PadR family transcriptional regulator